VAKPEFRKIVKDLVDTVEAAGGVFCDRKGCHRPAGDPDWVDLGILYVAACESLGKAPMIVDGSDIDYDN